MDAPLIWYFDVVSPFAYLALPRVEALARQRQVQFRPVVFAGLLAHWGQLGPAEIAPKRVHTYRLCQFMAERSGRPMRFPPCHPFRSLDALRLLAGLGAAPEATRVVFDFVWAEGRDPGDPTERDQLCGRFGIEDYEAFIDDSDAKAKLRTWTDEAIQVGVFGVPTLGVGDALFWGVDALPMAEAFLADATLLDSPEMARLAALPVGVARRT